MRDICMLYDSTPVGAHQSHTHTLYRFVFIYLITPIALSIKKKFFILPIY